MKLISRLIKKRITIIILVFIISFIALVSRLCFISFKKSDFINQKAYDQWTRQIPINSGRGKILDRNGNLIVGNKLALTVASINRQVKNKEETAEKLSSILQVSKDKILAHLNKVNSVEMIKPEGRKISPALAKEIMDLNLDGIYLASDQTRYYPYFDSLGQTLGFTNVDNDGITGIELTYNDYLKEVDGAINIYTDAKGNLMDNMVSYYEGASSGMDIYLTLDMTIVQILDSIVKNVALKYNPESIIACVSNVNTGEVLGISQYPFYEIEKYKEYDQEIYNRNFLVWKSYEPGSTFKICTYSAGLEENVFSFADSFHCSGVKSVANANIHCWKRTGHGSQTMLNVIENSCNTGFMNIGEKLGIQKLMKYIKSYGFGTKTGIDLIGETKGILFNEDNMGPVELATSSFGQGNSVTPIQLVQAMGACVNGGTLMKPFLLKYAMDQSGSIVYENNPKEIRRVISTKTSEEMRYALECVCSLGTGRNAYVNGYRIGGKTGTAQTVDENGQYSSSKYILSFLGAAPMNNPEVCVYFAIEAPKNTVQYGGVVAAPIVGEIMQQVLPYLEVKQDLENQIEKEYRYYIDERYFTVEDYIGLTKKAIPTNRYYKLLIVGEGDNVIDQIPSKGSKIKEGGTVVLYLG